MLPRLLALAVLVGPSVACADPPAVPGVPGAAPAPGAAAPERSKEELEALKAEMKTWADALGVKCRYCHDIKNFKAWTANRHIAEGMANIFLQKLKPLASTDRVRCSDCHSGKVEPEEAKVLRFGAAALKPLAVDFDAVSKAAVEPEAKEHLTDVAKWLAGLKP